MNHHRMGKSRAPLWIIGIIPPPLNGALFPPFFMTLLSPCFVYYYYRTLASSSSWSLLQRFTLAEVIGIRREGFIAAATLPLILTVVLFLGPLATLISDERNRFYTIPAYWTAALKNLIWWRNHVVAPFTEELTFRACMLPILLDYYSTSGAILISPLFFGFAHFHHMYERVKEGQTLLTAFCISAFQFAYTTVFGMYSALLFIRTGHLIAPVVVHGFCNFMGFPDLSEVLYQRTSSKKIVLAGLYVAGLILFYWLLLPVTEPNLYVNKVYSNW